MYFIFIILSAFLIGQDSTLVLLNEFEGLIIDTKSPDVIFLYPNGDEVFDGGETVNVQWNAQDDYFSDNEETSYPISGQ